MDLAAGRLGASKKLQIAKTDIKAIQLCIDEERYTGDTKTYVSRFIVFF